MVILGTDYLTQTRVILEEGISVKKISPPDWVMGKPVVMDMEGPVSCELCHPSAVGPGCYKKAGCASREEQQ